MRVESTELVDLSAISEEFDVPVNTLRQWRARGRLPDPVPTGARGPQAVLWKRSAIEKAMVDLV